MSKLVAAVFRIEGLTPWLKLYPVEGGAIANGVGDSMAAQTAGGTYLATVSEDLTGDYEAVIEDEQDGNVIGGGIVEITGSETTWHYVGVPAYGGGGSSAFSLQQIRDAMGLAPHSTTTTPSPTSIDGKLDDILEATSPTAQFRPWTIQVLSGSGSPIIGARVWVSTDAAGNNVVAGTDTTDDFGNVTFNLQNGTYYVWRDHSSYKLSNPTQMTVSHS